MSFSDRMASVGKEIRSGVRSKLYEETGRSVIEWRSLIFEFVDRMWEGDRFEVIRNFAYAAAIYEWAAINLGDLLFDSLNGSFGTFQAYREHIYDAYLNHPALRNYMSARGLGQDLAKMTQDFNLLSRGESCLFSDGPPSSRCRIPGPVDEIRTARIPKSNWLLSRSESTVFNSHVVNLIGKLDLSLDKARRARMEKDSLVWEVPDDVLCWILFCYEGAGEEGNHDRIATWSKLIAKAKESGDPNSHIEFQFGEGSQRREETLRTLGIRFAKSCQVRDLKPRINLGPGGDIYLRQQEGRSQ